MKLTIPLLLLFLAIPVVAQSNNYHTNFPTPTAENPISEGNKWITGFTTTGVLNNVQTSAGRALGVTNLLGPFNDPIAILNPATTGTWATIQSATGIVALGSATAFQFPEVELRLNTTLSSTSATSYEFSCSVLNHAVPAGCFIAKGLGPFPTPSCQAGCSFTILANDFDQTFLAPNGAVMQAINTGGTTNNLKLYVNGVLRAQATDHSFATGTPGIGFNAPQGLGGNNADYTQFELSYFSATDNPTPNNLWTGIINSNRAIDWSQAGLPGSTLPDTGWFVCPTISPYSGTDATITNALAACHTAHPTGGIVPLGAGTFTLSSGISFPQDTIGHLVLRGAGATLTQLNFTGTTCVTGGFICARSSDSSPGLVSGTQVNPRVVTVTSGFSKGSTQLILSSISTVVVGSILALNQCDTGYSSTGLGTACTGTSTDNLGYFHCQDMWTATNTGCAVPGEGGINGWRAKASEMEIALVTAVNQGACGATCVTLSKPIEQPDWSTAQGVQAAIIQPIPYVGVENLSLDAATVNGSSASGIGFIYVLHGWVSGTRNSNMPRLGISLNIDFGVLVKDNYFFGLGLFGYQDHFGIRAVGGGNNLMQNNICHNTRGCLFLGDATPENGDVFAYNYHTPTAVAGTQAKGVGDHGAGVSFTLFEGNEMMQWNEDGDHGNHLSQTGFRNHLYGWLSCANGQCAKPWDSTFTYCVSPNVQNVWYGITQTYYKCTAQNINTVPTNVSFWTPVTIANVPGGNNGSNQTALRLYYGARYGNFIGNVLGTPGYTTNYKCFGSFDDLCTYIWGAGQGGQPTDTLVDSTVMLWGNYDIANGATRFNAAEVPTVAPSYPNPVPGNQTLPTSFYLSSKPSWFGNLAWPPIGPDVTTGNVGQCAGTFNIVGQFNGVPATNTSQCTGSTLNTAWAKHANANPAMTCYFSMGGVPDGTGPILSFNPSTCYAPAAPGPALSFNPTSLNFGNQLINTTSAGRAVTVTNTGTANLVLSQISISGPYSQTNSCSLGFNMPPGASCTITVTFTPNATGTLGGTLQVNDNATGSPHTVPLSGVGTAPAISWNPTSYAFGPSFINLSTFSASIRLTNSGTATLNVALTIGGADAAKFIVSSTNCSGFLAPAAFCDSVVRFIPTAATNYNATLVETDPVAGAVSVPLTGSGVVAPVSIPAPWIPIQIGGR